MRNWSLVLMVLCGFLVACGGDKSGGSSKVPAKPINGSPVAAEFVKFAKGDGDKRSVQVRLYNFGDKPAVAYTFLLRYHDAAGKILKVKPGTPFEKDTDFMSMSGNKYRCNAKKHKTLTIDMLSVPKDAVRAEVLVTKVRTTSDGVKIEDWWSQKRWSQWPKAAAGTEAPPAPAPAPKK